MRSYPKSISLFVALPVASAVVFGPLLPTPAIAKPKASASVRLKVSDIAGRYVASSSNASYKTITIAFIAKTSKKDEFEQADFRGKIDGTPFVGQGIISGEEGRLENFIRFDFMFLNPQDSTLLMRSTSIMSKGKVVGLLINSVKYRRVR